MSAASRIKKQVDEENEAREQKIEKIAYSCRWYMAQVIGYNGLYGRLCLMGGVRVIKDG